MSIERRGRPKETPIDIKTKWTYEFYDIPSKPEIGCKYVWHYDIDKSTRGPYKTEVTYPKGQIFPNVKPEKGKAYNNQPVVLVFKTSNRSNAQTKMKVFANENIDYILSAPKLVGIPNTAIILECGVGKSLIKSYTFKYSL
jgi:hypothetical protein